MSKLFDFCDECKEFKEVDVSLCDNYGRLFFTPCCKECQKNYKSGGTDNIEVYWNKVPESIQNAVFLLLKPYKE